MSLIGLFLLVAYGFFVGIIAKAIHPGNDPKGFLWSVGIGIAGSLVGGFVSSMTGGFGIPGFIWAIAGGVVCCYLYGQYEKSQL